MLRYISPLSCIVLAIAFSLASMASAAAIKIPLKEVAKEWLAAKGIKDASKDLEKVLVAAEKGEKTPGPLLDFERAILDGKPLDREKHALAVALNLLRLDDFVCLVVVADYKKNGVTAFTETDGVALNSGRYESEIDLAVSRTLKELGKVRCEIKRTSAKVDQFEVIKDMPGTARLTFLLTITVVSGDSKAEHRRTVGPFRITAWEDVEFRNLKKWEERPAQIKK